MGVHPPATLAGQLIAAKADRILSRFDPSARGADEQRRHASALLHLATQASGDGSYAARAIDDTSRILEKDRKLAATMVSELARDAFSSQELREAIALYEIAIAIHANDDWRVMTGFTQLQAQDFAGAKRSFEAVRGFHAQHSKYRASLCDLQLRGTDLSTLKVPDDPAEARVLENVLFHVRGGHHSPENQAQLQRERREQDARFRAQLVRLRVMSFLSLQWRRASRLLRQAFGRNGVAGSNNGVPEGPQKAALELALRTAREFAEHLVRWDFVAADAMLTGAAQPSGGAEDLRTAYLRMTQREDDDGQPDAANVEALDAMPANDSDHGADDLGWVYVSISGERFGNEAVTVIVTRVQGQPRIRSLEWGRP